MRKKIPAILLSLCMLLMLMPSALAAQTRAAIELDKSEVQRGGQITAVVSIKDAVNATGATYKLTYDTSVLEAVSAEKGSLMNYSYASIGMVSMKQGSVNAVLGFDSAYNITDDVLFTVTFKVKEDAVLGMHRDVIACSSNVKDCNISDSTGAAVQISTEAQSDINVVAAPAKIYTFNVEADKMFPLTGDIVTYKITAPEAVQISGWQADLSYDPEVLEYVEGGFYMSGGYINDVESGGAASGKTVLLWADMSGGTAEFSGDVAYVSYRIRKAGSTAIQAKVVSAPAECAMNFPEVTVSGNGVISASADKAKAKVGDTVKITVSASEFKNQAGIQFDVVYDPSSFNIDKDTIKYYSGADSRLIEEGRIRFLYADMTGITGEAELITFELKATGKNGGTASVGFEDAVGEPVFRTEGAEVYLFNSEDTEKINRAAELIQSLPAAEDITAENYDTVKEAAEQARTAYELLPEEAKELVDTAALEACENVFADVQGVIDIIDALEEPEAAKYLTASTAVAAARAAYDALSDEAKTRVNNYDKLTAAEAALAELKSAVDSTEALIEAIGDVTAERYAENKAAVAAAEEAYGKLEGEQKQAVENAQKLSDAQSALSELKKQVTAVEIAINAIGEVNKENYKEKKEIIEAARAAYDALTEDMRGDVSNAGALLMAESIYEQFARDIDIEIQTINTGYEVSVIKNNEQMSNQTVIIAVYNNDGTLAEAVMTSTAQSATTTVEADTKNQSCRVFVWDSASGMRPYESVSITQK